MIGARANVARGSGRWRRLALGFLVAVSVGASIAQTPPRASWDAALERLVSSDPMTYLELGEEIADAATTPEETDLARRLFALAGLLDRANLARSACLALADLAGNDQEHRRLRALASLLGPGSLMPGAGLDADDESALEPGSAPAIAVTEAFSHYRRGQGSRALTALREPGAEELLRACDRFLYGGAHRFLEDCKLYRGRLRPGISEEDRVRMLRLEIALLTGEERPWSSELLFTSGAPLVEVDPVRLEDAFGIDASRPRYRDGRWVPDGGGP